jgi:hypothetical protein
MIDGSSCSDYRATCAQCLPFRLSSTTVVRFVILSELLHCSLLSFLVQLLQEGTQLLSELLDDSSLNVLIDQMELVGFGF